MLIYAIDDEKAVLHYTMKALREYFQEDAEILPFSDVDEMLDAFTASPADIVFLDIEMPGYNGIELAAKLNRIKPDLNIVFVTGYDQYALEAFDVYASDYMKKPCSVEKIEKAMQKLRYPIGKEKDIFVKTFGNFDVFYQGVPVRFRSELEKEMLAYLIDREGALVSRQEMAGILFEDDFSRSRQVHLSKLAERLAGDLSDAGIVSFFYSENGYRVDMTVCDCDLTEWKKGSLKYRYTGEYMEQYSFAEYRKGDFEK